MPNIVRIQGIGPTYAKKLVAARIKTADNLLEAGSGKKGRTETSKKTGITDKIILEWVNRSDFFRIKRV